MFRLLAVVALAAASVCAAAERAAEIPSDVRAALGRINADSMRGHVSFLASDLLEGRGTPSRGLDIAAEYIAAQFRRAGLEPAGDDGYFQTARFVTLEPNAEGLRFEAGGAAIDPSKITLDVTSAVALDGVEAIKWAEGQVVEGKVVFVHAPDFRAMFAARRLLANTRPALVVMVGAGAVRPRQHNALIPADERGKSLAVLAVSDDDLTAKIEHAPPGPLPFRVNVSIAAPVAKDVKLRNVAARLHGSDAALKDTWVLVTAHYDHLGMRAAGEGDRIYNGANDDASGTASLIEVAGALNGLNPHPRRSFLFVALFGEEAGLLGSRYYGAHPIEPLSKTVTDINLEHMGRTDSNLGAHVGMVNFTGFDFSDVPSFFRKAGELTDVRVVKDEKNSDPYFARSDNQALADLGVPAHTVSVSYEFPDYHRVGDEWEKLDYDNMARVDRMIALGLFLIAENPQPPRWRESDKTRKYVEAGQKQHP